jgi:hypothetical protein
MKRIVANTVMGSDLDKLNTLQVIKSAVKCVAKCSGWQRIEIPSAGMGVFDKSQSAILKTTLNP